MISEKHDVFLCFSRNDGQNHQFYTFGAHLTKNVTLDPPLFEEFTRLFTGSSLKCCKKMSKNQKITQKPH